MIFELAVARKYLIPRVRQLSVSVISLISIFVISAVVWLSIVFFSAQEGIEKKWAEKLVAITSSLRILPTEKYYDSYYYQIDALSGASGFTHKNLRQKAKSVLLDPFNPNADASLPTGFPVPTQKDLVKSVIQTLKKVGLDYDIFDTAYATLKIQIEKKGVLQQITQAAYITNVDIKNPFLQKTLIGISPEQVQQLFGNTILQKISPILLPKAFIEAGVHVGDMGNLYYEGFGATGSKEQHSSIIVMGFYDPGIIPVGGKVLLAQEALVADIQKSSLIEERSLPTGFNVHVQDLSDVSEMKNSIVKQLAALGISEYWDVQTFAEYDFTRDIFQQMKSDRNLFSLISIIIMIVACSNIISMLIILVHDKRKEIAIMRALGATKFNVASIFGICGFFMGAFGSAIGSFLAILTIKNLSVLLAFLGSLQGFEVLNSAFYGNSIPQEISVRSLFFVIISCTAASTIAGIVPAIQASRINTSEALRNE